MTIYDTTWYANYGNGSSTGYYAVSQWTASHGYSVGNLVRQLATPTTGQERIFVCTATGTSLSSEPAWTITYGAVTTEAAGPTWQEVTGRTAVNGDSTNTNTWTALKNKAVVLGQLMINGAGNTYFIVTTAGTTGNGSEPSWNTTAGATTSDNTVTWTSLGAIGNFSTWGAPFARIQTPLATGFAIAGNVIYVGSAHAETQSTAMSMGTTNGTNAAGLQLIGASTAAAPPTTLSTAPTITTTGASSISLPNNTYGYGLNFTCGSGSSSGCTISFPSDYNVWESCSFACASTINGTGGGFGWGAPTSTPSGAGAQVLNSTFKFGAVGQVMNNSASGQATIIGGSVAATGSVPTQLFSVDNVATRIDQFLFRDCDLSAVTTKLADLSKTNSGYFNFYNCKLGTGVTYASTFPSGISGTYLKIHNSDSTSTNYKYYYRNYAGTVQSETTVVRSGGASNGVTSLSWNIATNTTASFNYPFATDEIAQWWNSTGSSHTATIYLTSNTSLSNNQVWVNLEYPGSSSAPLGSNVTSRAAFLTTPVALTSDTSTWGGSISNKYKIAVTFTPQMVGPVKAVVYVAVPSITVYVDPLIVIT